MTLFNKVMTGLLGIQFMSGFLSGQQKPSALTEEQLCFVTRSILNCTIYQTLISEGKTAAEISALLEIKKMTPAKFKALTGQDWPV